MQSQRPRLLLVQVRPEFQSIPAEDNRIVVSVSDEYHEALFNGIDLAATLDAQFLIFPEYAWPRVWIDEAISHLNVVARPGMLFILPIEHLTLTEYLELLQTTGVDETTIAAEDDDARRAAPLAAPDEIIVNAALLIVCDDAEKLHVIPQRKLRPAALEEKALATRFRFAEGTIVRTVCGDARVAALICFDYIARDEGYRVEPRELLRDARLTHLFVPECNPSPLHSFYTSALLDTTIGGELPPVQIFCNVAAGTELPPLEDPVFGFSRIIGDLGTINPLRGEGSVAMEGLLSNPKIRTFEQLQQTDKIIEDRAVRSIYLRPEQTAVEVLLPPSGMRPSSDPRRGRVNTTVQTFRYFEPPAGWTQIRPAPKYEKRSWTEVPRDYLVEWSLFGVDEHVDRFRELLYRSNEPIWIIGEGGVGKTAIAARVIADEAAERVIWIDMAQLQHDEGALTEALLLSLGGGDALARKLDKQVEEIVRRARTKVTVIVLDSFEKWQREFPEWLVRIGGWKTRLVITSRARPEERVDDPMLFVDRPSLENAARLVRAVSGAPPDAQSAEILARLAGRLPVGCVWAGQFAKQSPQTAEAVAAELEGQDEPLTSLLRALLRDVSPTAQSILGILCELPAPVSKEDLRDIAGITLSAVNSAIDTLRDRNLLMTLPTAGERRAGVHFRHPFVKDFWRASAAPQEQSVIEKRLIEWCRKLVAKYGGDRNWRGLSDLESRWQNIGYVIRERVAGNPHDDNNKRIFLELWEGVDTFLWSTRRWRERMELGRIAIEFADALDQPLAKGRALYESLAQPEWHLHSDRTAAEPLIDEAVKIFSNMDPTPIHLVRAEWYRSRMLLRCKFADEALHAARYALDLASRLPARDGSERDRKHASGLALHGLGNALTELRDYAEAMKAYEQARECFSETGDREMMAVVARRMGAVYLEEGEQGKAARMLEESLKEFREMRIPLEEAETATLFARLLKEIGDTRDARRYLEFAENVLGDLGSIVRNRELDDAKRVIERQDSPPA